MTMLITMLMLMMMMMMMMMDDDYHYYYYYYDHSHFIQQYQYYQYTVNCEGSQGDYDGIPHNFHGVNPGHKSQWHTGTRLQEQKTTHYKVATEFAGTCQGAIEFLQTSPALFPILPPEPPRRRGGEKLDFTPSEMPNDRDIFHQDKH